MTLGKLSNLGTNSVSGLVPTFKWDSSFKTLIIPGKNKYLIKFSVIKIREISEELNN